MGFLQPLALIALPFDRVTDPYPPHQSASAPHYPLGSDDVSHECEADEQGHGASSAFPHPVDACLGSRGSDFRNQSSTVWWMVR